MCRKKQLRLLRMTARSGELCMLLGEALLHLSTVQCTVWPSSAAQRNRSKRDGGRHGTSRKLRDSTATGGAYMSVFDTVGFFVSQRWPVPVRVLSCGLPVLARGAGTFVAARQPACWTPCRQRIRCASAWRGTRLSPGRLGHGRGTTIPRYVLSAPSGRCACCWLTVGEALYFCYSEQMTIVELRLVLGVHTPGWRKSACQTPAALNVTSLSVSAVPGTRRFAATAEGSGRYVSSSHQGKARPCPPRTKTSSERGKRISLSGHRETFFRPLIKTESGPRFRFPSCRLLLLVL